METAAKRARSKDMAASLTERWPPRDATLIETVEAHTGAHQYAPAVQFGIDAVRPRDHAAAAIGALDKRKRRGLVPAAVGHLAVAVFAGVVLGTLGDGRRIPGRCSR